jgi:cytochrome d ubiquinol oxidase subunit I
MEQQAFLLDLLRLKFGFMACFHYVFVPLTIGLILSVACMEIVFVRTRAAAWKLAAHFWFRIFTVAWIVGIFTGYPLRAQLESDWGNYATFVKPVLSQVLPLEAALGPVMLVSVVVLVTLGHRLFPITRMLLTALLALCMLCQSATILSVNAWMQHPVGIDAHDALSHPPALEDLLGNPMAISKMAHVFSAALMCGATLISGVAALYLYEQRHEVVAKVSLRLGVLLGAGAAVLVVMTGHYSAAHVERFQPMKFAAFEGLWKHEEGPAGLILYARPQLASQINQGEIKIPYAMSVLAGYGLSGSPPGIREVLVEQEERIHRALLDPADRAHSRMLDGYRELFARERGHWPAAMPDGEVIHRAALRTVPNVPVLFGGFRTMVFVGVALSAFYLLALLLQSLLRGQRRQLLLLMPGILPLPWLASTCGWLVAEMGRQPWAVYGYLPTVEAVRLPSLAQGVFSTLFVTSLYAVLGCLFVVMLVRIIRRGPGAPILWGAIPAPMLPDWHAPSAQLAPRIPGCSP